MITFLQDGADGEYINIFELGDKHTLQELGLTKLFLGRIISSTDDVPEVPSDLTPILWIAPFSASDRTHVRQARSPGLPASPCWSAFYLRHAGPPFICVIQERPSQDASFPFFADLYEQEEAICAGAAACTHERRPKAQSELSACYRCQRAGKQEGALRPQGSSLLSSA